MVMDFVLAEMYAGRFALLLETRAGIVTTIRAVAFLVVLTGV
jgi:hypothetical protein